MTEIKPPSNKKGSFLQDPGKRRLAFFGGAIGFAALIFFVTGSGDQGGRSSTVAGPSFPEVVPTESQELSRSPTFLQNIQEETEDRANEAAASGRTAVAPFLTPEVKDVRQEPVKVAAVVQGQEDPFAQLIAQEAERQSRRNSRIDRLQPRPLPSRPNVDEARLEAISAVMGDIIRQDIPRPSVGLAFDIPEDPEPMEEEADGDGGESVEDEGKILVRAGSILYGQIDLGLLNTEPGPVRATLLTGPYPGAYLLGSFAEADRSLLIRFDTLVAEDGREQPISAIAVDPDTRRAGIVDKYSSRFWERAGLAFVARAVQGFGETAAIADSTVTTSVGTIVSDSQAPSTEDALFAGLGRGAEVVAEQVEARANTIPEIKQVFAGREVGVIFLSSLKER